MKINIRIEESTSIEYPGTMVGKHTKWNSNRNSLENIQMKNERFKAQAQGKLLSSRARLVKAQV